MIASLSSLASLGLLKRMYLWDVCNRVLGFLYHPDVWIRQSAAGFIAAAAKNLPTSDVWCILYPSLRSSLRSDIVTLDEDSILNALSPPVSCTTLRGRLTSSCRGPRCNLQNQLLFNVRQQVSGIRAIRVMRASRPTVNQALPARVIRISSRIRGFRQRTRRRSSP